MAAPNKKNKKKKKKIHSMSLVGLGEFWKD